MDFTLRCNSLKCRDLLTDKAVVTTCSHLFCVPCAEALGLLKSAWAQRRCPACLTLLNNPDDAVSTSMNPTEDYKTSVLSGLNPTIIMECASRAVGFWSYQATQEITYQEYLAKTLTEKYGNLSLQMDNIINEANTEMDLLNQKMEAMKVEHEKMKQEHTNLVTAYREKVKKYQQLDNLYATMKRKEMTAATEAAAYDTADEVLQSASARLNLGTSGNAPFRYGSRNENMQNRSTHDNLNGQQQQPQQSYFNRMPGMAPPPRPNAGMPQSNLGSHHNPITTPSHHRTRLGPDVPSAAQQPQRQFRPSGSFNSGPNPSNQTPPRSTLVDVSNAPGSRSGVSGYGMSAGMKIGRQQAARPEPPVQPNPNPPPMRSRLGPSQ